MSTTTAGVLFLLVLLAALAMVHVPFGDYMFRVYTSGRDSHVERVIYRLIGVDSCAEKTRGAYARSVLAFSSVSILFLFGFQLVQGTLPLHLHDPATRMAPTASGSGLDPNISPAYADLQVARVARARWPGPGTSARSRSLSRWRRAEPGVAWGFSASHASTCCSSTCNSTAGIRSRARNRLGWTSSWPGCGPRSAAPPRRRRPTNR